MDEVHNRLQDFLDYSLDFKRNATKTVKEIKSCFLSLHDHAIQYGFEEFNSDAIEHWIIHKRKTLRWSEKTVNTRLTYLNLFSNYLLRKQVIHSNPIKEVERPRLPKTLPRPISQSDCLSLLVWVKNFSFRTRFERFRGIAIIATFIGTGMRYEEVYNLQVQDVDLDQMELFVRSGKGKKDRMIPFKNSLKVIFEQYLTERKRIGKTCPYFFASSRYNAKMGPKVIYQLCWKLREESGIDFTPHKLRHSYATELLKSGASIRTVQELLGHGDIKVTALYLAVTGQYLKEEVRQHGMDV